MSRMSILIGAGATQDLTKISTKNLTDLLIGDREYGMQFKEIQKYLGDDASFEQILGHLLFLYSVRADAVKQKSPFTLALIKNPQSPKFSDETVLDMMKKALMQICIRVNESNHLPRCSTCAFDTLMTLLFDSHSGQTSIFSLNYDSIVEQWISGKNVAFETGFGIERLVGYEHSAAQFDSVEELFDQKCNIVCHLHGSIYYGVRTDITPETPYQYSLFKYKQPVTTEGNSTLIQQNGDGTHSFLSPIVIGANKQVQITEAEPFPIYHSLFTRDTMTSRIFVIIGYGFHDDYINWNLSGLFQTAKQGRLVIMIKPPDKTPDATGHTKDRDTFEKFCESNTMDTNNDLIWTSDAVIWYRGRIEDAVKDE